MNNKFVQAVGVASIAYVFFLSLSWALSALTRATFGFTYWMRYTLQPNSWLIAIALGVVWLLWAVSSRRER